MPCSNCPPRGQIVGTIILMRRDSTADWRKYKFTFDDGDSPQSRLGRLQTLQ